MCVDDGPGDWHGPRPSDEETRRRLDDLLSLLSERRRRDLLSHLVAVGVTDVETLAPKVAAAQEAVSPDEIPPDVRKQVQTTLVHTHLPKLADAGAIEFDPRTGAIRCRDLPPMLQPLVDTCRDIEGEE